MKAKTTRKDLKAWFTKNGKFAAKWFSKVILDPPISANNYYDLYSSLMELFTFGNYWVYFRGVLSILLFIALIFSLIVINNNWKSTWTILIMLTTMFGLYFCVAMILLFLRVIRPNLTYSPKKFVKELAAMLLVIIPRPYTQESGLLYEDIVRLKRVAEAERDSVEWRSNFINLVILGSINIIFWVALWLLRTNGASILATKNAVTAPNDQLIFSNQFPIIALIWAFAVVILTAMFRFYDYLGEYLSSESPNRLIILSCEEALSFCEKFGIGKLANYSLEQKKSIALHFGCRLFVLDEQSRKKYSQRSIIRDELGEEWYLSASHKIKN